MIFAVYKLQYERWLVKRFSGRPVDKINANTWGKIGRFSDEDL